MKLKLIQFPNTSDSCYYIVFYPLLANNFFIFVSYTVLGLLDELLNIIVPPFWAGCGWGSNFYNVCTPSIEWRGLKC